MAVVAIPQIIKLRDLPDVLFPRIAGYLACPSRALFAVAMPYEGPSRAVVSSFSPCAVLDFGELEESAAAKLSDDDIHDILIQVDASNNLKTLKISGCTSIVGSGLASLAASGTIQIIDLVVEKGESETGASSSLSADAVIPIISSIVEVWRNDTNIQSRHSHVTSAAHERYLDLPSSFLEGPTRTSVAQQFKDTYCQSVLTAIMVAPKPKRAMSSFFHYSVATRGNVKADNPNASFGEVARMIATNFKALPKEELDHWDQKAVEDRGRYREEMKKFLHRKRLKFNIYHTGGGRVLAAPASASAAARSS